MTESDPRKLHLDTDLLQLYKIAIDEYRFVVQMGWNRQQYYLVFNSALTGLASTLLGQRDTMKALFAMMVFGLGAFACFLGRAAITKAHEYYRNTAYKKTLIEDLLGLAHKLPEYKYSGANLTIATTAGMHSTSQILNDTLTWLQRPERRGNIVWYLRGFLLVLFLIDCAGAVIAAWVALAS